MKSLNDYFDKIYSVHIETSEERLDNITGLEKALNCEIEIFPCFMPEPEDIQESCTVSTGTFGCTYSHIKLWEKIVQDKPKRPLILEDDSVINPILDAGLVFDLLDGCDIIDDVDLLYLGVNFKTGATEYINDHLYKLLYAPTTNAYSPTLASTKKLLEHLSMDHLMENPNRIIDIEISKLINKGALEGRIINPAPLIQQPGHSWLLNRFADYRISLTSVEVAEQCFSLDDYHAFEHPYRK